MYLPDLGTFTANICISIASIRQKKVVKTFTESLMIYFMKYHSITAGTIIQMKRLSAFVKTVKY